MITRNTNKLSYLDEEYKKNGGEKLKSVFHETAEKQKEKAVNLINDKGLNFCPLFILLPEIDKFNLYESLSSRNLIAIKLCAKILKNDNLKSKVENLAHQDDEQIHEVLKWIFRTGVFSDGLSNEYDEVLDSAASLLINTYKDKTIIPILVDIIFKRNRKGYLIHDLVWVFFKACDPQGIKLIAGYLLSREPKDIELARELLNFLPVDNDNMNRHNLYSACMSYLKENNPFLHFTGESFLLTSKPNAYDVDLPSKYLHKQHSATLTDNENNCLECFNNADTDIKEMLSKYSHKLYNQNLPSWKKWIQNSFEEQVNIAKKYLGGRS